jgi:hypothetical protein
LHAIARDADSTEDTEAGREITGRVLVVQVEKIIDPREQLDPIVDRIVAPQVDESLPAPAGDATGSTTQVATLGNRPPPSVASSGYGASWVA